MSIRHTMTVRGGAAATAVVAGLILVLAGCGGDSDDGKPKGAASSPGAPSSKGGSEAPEAEESPEPEQVIATLQGQEDITFEVTSAVRDAGGFLTVSGHIKNNGSKAFVHAAAWRGNELTSSGMSIAGAALVDQKGKKRYYVLRDTDGRCLCTTGLNRIGAGESVPAFAQFPAPPEGTAEVDFSLPTFATATIKISG